MRGQEQTMIQQYLQPVKTFTETFIGQVSVGVTVALVVALIITLVRKLFGKKSDGIKD